MQRLAESFDTADHIQEHNICRAAATWVLGAAGVVAGTSWILISAWL